MTTFFLVRHGETEWNTQRRIQGWADSPLTSLGLAQAEAHGRLLGMFRIDRVLGINSIQVKGNLFKRNRIIHRQSIFIHHAA